MDTTATNAATIDTPALTASGAVFGRDGQHVYNLGTEDLEGDAVYSSANAPAHAMSVWMRASAKRSGPLATVQGIMGIKRPLRNMASNPTRFSETILTAARELHLVPAYQQLLMLQPAKQFFDPGTFAEFSTRFAALAGVVPVLTGLVHMLRPLLQITPRLGSDNEYTASIRTYSFRRILDHVISYKADPLIGSTAAALERSLWRRLANVATLEGPHSPAGIMPLTALERRRRVAEDAVLNAAAYLDPALIPYFTRQGGRVADAQGDILRILKANARIVAGPAPVAAPPGAVTAAQRDAAIAAIRARPKPDVMMADEEWVAEQDQLVDLEHQRYAEGRAGGGGGGAAAAAQNADPFAPFQEALVKEFAVYDRHRIDIISAAEQQPPVLTYGDPLEPNHPARYEYWPRNQQALPIMFQAARIILCIRLHSMGNERDHNVMGRLFSKARASLHADSFEMLVLGHHYLLLELQANKARIDTQLADGVDPQQIEDEFEARMQGALAALGDGSASDSGSD
jgi:hypothetical protein